jgi:mannose-1-phosphate guanylyltransferase
VRGARCFIFNGDIFTDLKLPAMLEAHRGAGAEISIALTEVEDPSRFGVIETDAARRILSFTEKPPRELARSRAINAGIYLFERAIFARFPDGPCSVERDIFPTLLAEGVHLLGYQEPLYWTDLGTPVDYLQAHLDILTRRVNLPLDYPEVRPGIWQGRDVRIADSACVRPPVLLGDGAVIEAGATVGPAVVLGERTRIGAHAQVEGSVLWAEAVVRRGGRVRGSVLGRGAVVSGLIVDGIFEDFAQVLDTAA